MEVAEVILASIPYTPLLSGSSDIKDQQAAGNQANGSPTADPLAMHAHMCEGDTPLLLQCNDRGGVLTVMAAKFSLTGHNIGSMSTNAAAEQWQPPLLDMCPQLEPEQSPSPAGVQLDPRSHPDLRVRECAALEPDVDDVDAARAVMQLCDGRRSCSVRVHPQVLGGDPCPGVRKQLHVRYTCAVDSWLRATHPLHFQPLRRNPSTAPNRTVLLTYLQQRYGFSSYLEIGCDAHQVLAVRDRCRCNEN